MFDDFSFSSFFIHIFLFGSGIRRPFFDILVMIALRRLTLKVVYSFGLSDCVLGLGYMFQGYGVGG